VRDHRGEGNGFLLPAGPLREPANRDRDITLVTGNSQGAVSTTDMGDGLHYIADRPAFTLEPILEFAYPLGDPDQITSLEALLAQHSNTSIIAVAAIGNPQRFFDGIQSLLPYHTAPFKGIALPDHGQIEAALLNTLDAKCILITEKDAVKCMRFGAAHHWVLAVEAQVDAAFGEHLMRCLERRA
jgi:tetraacyldisaccharide 4'-kinase